MSAAREGGFILQPGASYDIINKDGNRIHFFHSVANMAE